MPIPAVVRERLDYVRVVAGLFFSNAIIYAVLLYIPDNTTSRILVLLMLGLCFVSIYFILCRFIEKIYEDSLADDEMHHHHYHYYNNNNNEQDNRQYDTQNNSSSNINLISTKLLSNK